MISNGNDRDRIKRCNLRFFYNFLSVQITANILGAHHAQHAVGRVVRRDSSAIKFESLNHIYFSHILWAEAINQ